MDCEMTERSPLALPATRLSWLAVSFVIPALLMTGCSQPNAEEKTGAGPSACS